MTAYLYKAKMQILVSLTYRFEVFATLLTRYIEVVAVVFLWECVYKSQDTLKGMTKEQMITWIILAAGMSVLYTTGVQNEIRIGVVKGNIAVELLRPCNLLGLYFSQDMGAFLVRIVTGFVPTVILGGLTFGMMMPVSTMNLVLSLVSLVAGYMIIWLLFALIGVFTFWAMELGNMTWGLQTIISIFSGNLIPLYFFPESVQGVLRWLPFQYTYQAPLALYVGKITWEEGLQQIGVQILWIVLLTIVLNLLWKRIRKNILVQGG